MYEVTGSNAAGNLVRFISAERVELGKTVLSPSKAGYVTVRDCRETQDAPIPKHKTRPSRTKSADQERADAEKREDDQGEMIS